MALFLPVDSYAQANQPAGTKPVGVAPSVPLPELLARPLPSLSFVEKPVSEIAAELSRRTGVLVLADSTVAALPVTLSVQGLSFHDTLKQLMRMVPGTTIRLMALPGQEQTPDADLIMQIVALQDTLQLTASSTTTTKAQNTTSRQATGQTLEITTIEVAGQRVPITEAHTSLNVLKLRPVFVLTNPTIENLVAKSSRLQAENLQTYLSMTPEQRVRAVDQQIETLLNMDSTTRRALFEQMQQQGASVMKKIQSLPPETRAQFFRDLTNGRWDGTMPPPRPPQAGNGNPGSQP